MIKKIGKYDKENYCVLPGLPLGGSTKVSLVEILERNVTKFAPHLPLRIIACGKFLFEAHELLRHSA